MTLARTAQGAIKIKTTGGSPRAVGCGCCGGCACYDLSLDSIVIAGEPEFAAKLRGDHAQPYTQLSLSYSIAAQTPPPSNISTSASESLNLQWGSVENCENIIRAASGFPESNCRASLGCGSYYNFCFEDGGILLVIFLRPTGCLAIYLEDEITGCIFSSRTSICDETAPINTGQASVIVNNTTLPTQFMSSVRFDHLSNTPFPDATCTGNMTLVFS